MIHSLLVSIPNVINLVLSIFVTLTTLNLRNNEITENEASRIAISLADNIVIIDSIAFTVCFFCTLLSLLNIHI